MKRFLSIIFLVLFLCSACISSNKSLNSTQGTNSKSTEEVGQSQNSTQSQIQGEAQSQNLSKTQALTTSLSQNQSQSQNQVQTKPKSTVQNSSLKYKREPIDTSVWDLAVVDSARNVDYMSDIEKDIVLEMNMARTNPKKYAELYIEPRSTKFNGKIYGGKLKTVEGVSAVTGCVKFMSKQSEVSVLIPSKGLTLAAKDHANTQALTGKTGHTGIDGAGPLKRMSRYGSYTNASENISYGSKTAREIVVSLLIDDGVSSRGHRKNILSRDFKKTGVAFANQHKVYGCECVIDYVGEYIEDTSKN